MDIVPRPGIPATPGSTAPVAAAAVPAQIAGHGSDAQETWLEFFAAQIRNPNTRTAYAQAAYRLFDWLADHGVTDVCEIRPVHIAAWLESRMREASRPTVKQELAAIRCLFDWLTVRQVVPHSPAATVRGPKHSVRRGKTPRFSPPLSVGAFCGRFRWRPSEDFATGRSWPC